MRDFFYTVLLLSFFLSLGIATESSSSEPDSAAGSGIVSDADSSKVIVFYLTNRARLGDQPQEVIYGGYRGIPIFGHCEVEFTPIPIVKDVASKLPFYLQGETDSVKFVEEPNHPQFWIQLDDAVRTNSSETVVLFIHGYNYNFERACLMAAQMQRSLEGMTTVIAFSWPSNGLASDYVSDLVDVEWSVPLLTDFISQLSERFNSKGVQVVAHSLGSRGAIFALQKLGAQKIEPPVIAKLVLLAPDFDSQTFVDALPGIKTVAGHITLYASANDTPLKLSHQLSGYPRLGEAGDYLTVVEGVDTIDISSTGRYQITGHEYFRFNPKVVDDLVMLLGHGTHAPMRPGLQPNKRGGLVFWEAR
ncbi:MAG: alpha/beta fold hydrolase [Arenicellales bacterium]